MSRSFHSPPAAARTAAALLEGIERLGRFPEIGHPVSLAPDPASVRDLIIGDHVVRYVPRPEVVIILRVRHRHERQPGEPPQLGGEE